ncbi:M56 family metallopeptidase [Terriglobus sp. RCC_193]|uniref:M56 family metallopeptidase n=1 Tax=Terriglobus sp. RCC_193 TaxID=3239218 RepID=UPI003523E203
MTPVLAHISSVMATSWAASLWQGLALSLLAVALLRLMPKASAALRHSILLAVFAAATVLPLLHMPMHVAAMAPQASPAAIRMAPWFAVAVAAVWLVTSLFRAISLGMAWMHLRQVRRDATPIAVEAMNIFTAGNRRAVLCSSSQVSSPAVLGFFRPVLLLPEWLVPSLSPDELRQIAAHECEHLRRRDDWINLALQIGLVLMPLNPALLWLNRRIAEQRELACDAAVVASTAQPLAYAASLTRMAEQRMQQNGLRLALAALGRKSELAQRVHALLREPVAGWSRRQSAAACSMAAFALLAASAGLSRVPRLIRVAPAEIIQPEVAVTTPAKAIELYHQKSVAAAPEGRMVPAAFEVPLVRKSARHAVKQTAVKHEANATLAPKTNAPRLLRTATTATRGPRMIDTATQDDMQQPRFITTEFIQPYVAVPVRGGWLLIEL